MMIPTVQAQFQIAVGGTGSDISSSSIQTNDGGFIFTGSTNSFGAGLNDIYVIKVDNSGNIVWTRTIGGPDSDIAPSIIQTSDNGFVLTGSTTSFGAGQTDLVVVKLSSTGILTWFKTIGGVNSETGSSICETSDGGFAVSGHTSSYGAGADDIYVLKFNASGNLQWNKVIGGGALERTYSIITSNDGGYVVCGQTQSYGAGANDAILLKIDINGNLQWCKTFGTSQGEVATRVIQSVDGGFVITCHTGQNQTNQCLAKVNSSGEVQWQNYITAASGFGTNMSCIQSLDSGFLMSGFTNLGAGSRDFYLAKFNMAGTFQWMKTIGSTGFDIATSLIQSSDGSITISGYTNSYGSGNNDMYIVKLDEKYNSCENLVNQSISSGTWGTAQSHVPNVTSSAPVIDSYTPISVTGGTLTPICGIVGLPNTNTQIPDNFCLMQNYPNPFNPSTRISFNLSTSGFTTLKVYDIMGREVSELESSDLNAGSHSVTFNGENLASGIYYYRLESSGNVAVKKMLLVK